MTGIKVNFKDFRIPWCDVKLSFPTLVTVKGELVDNYLVMNIEEGEKVTIMKKGNKYYYVKGKKVIQGVVVNEEDIYAALESLGKKK